MSHDDSSATRRIMSQLGEPRTVPLLNVTEGDVGVLVGLPVAGLLVAGVLASLLGLVLSVVLSNAGVLGGIQFGLGGDVTRRTVTSPDSVKCSLNSEKWSRESNRTRSRHSPSDPRASRTTPSWSRTRCSRSLTTSAQETW